MRREGAANVIDLRDARAQLARLLAEARPEEFSRFTVEGLARINRTPRQDIRAMLYLAQLKRMQWHS